MTAAAIPQLILGVPFGGVAGQTIVAGAGGVPAWSDTFARGKTIDLGTGALPSPLGAGTFPLTLAGVDGSQQVIEAFGFGGAPCLGIRRRAAGGTRAAPTAVPNATAFGYDIASGYDGTAWQNNAAYIGFLADATWSGSNRGTMLIWTLTPNGSVTAAEWMRLQNAALTLGGIAATAGNGLLQLAPGTTKANGIAFGTDTFLYRNASGSLITDGSFSVGGTSATALLLSGGLYMARNAGSDAQVVLQINGTGSIQFGFNKSGSTNATGAVDGEMYFGSNGALPLAITTTGTRRFRIDGSGNFHLRGGTPTTPSAFTAWTGTPTRSSIATGSATVANCAEAIKALIDDLKSIGVLP